MCIQNCSNCIYYEHVKSYRTEMAVNIRHQEDSILGEMHLRIIRSKYKFYLYLSNFVWYSRNSMKSFRGLLLYIEILTGELYHRLLVMLFFACELSI